MNVTNIIMRGLNRDSPKKVIELFNVVLGRKKDLEKCRGKLIIKTQRSKFFIHL